MNNALTINSKKSGYIINISKFILENNYTLENALEILLSNILSEESIQNN